MIDELPKVDKQYVSVKKLKELELDILNRRGFNLNFLGPTEFISRYLCILD